MLVMLNGKKRTEAEFRHLFSTAGFKLTQIIPNIIGLVFSKVSLYKLLAFDYAGGAKPIKLCKNLPNNNIQSHPESVLG